MFLTAQKVKRDLDIADHLYYYEQTDNKLGYYPSNIGELVKLSTKLECGGNPILSYIDVLYFNDKLDIFEEFRKTEFSLVKAQEANSIEAVGGNENEVPHIFKARRLLILLVEWMKCLEKDC